MLEDMLEVRYGVYSSPFGPVRIGVAGEAVAHLSFIEEAEAETAPRDEAIVRLGKQIFAAPPQATAFPLQVAGTPFQQRVWKALCAIPAGQTVTYGELARRIGSPRAARAVGAACGQNEIAWLIPCHRVVAADGGLGGYHWGQGRKAAMLAWENNLVGRA